MCVCKMILFSQLRVLKAITMLVIPRKGEAEQINKLHHSLGQSFMLNLNIIVAMEMPRIPNKD